MILPPIPPGHRNGRLTVLAFERDPKRPRHPHYRCRCDCGREVLVQRANLPRTHSCGCIKVEMLKAKATHGMSHTNEFDIWAGMIDRCTRITVCQRWLDSFAHFYADMGPRPAKQWLDRIDNALGYTPENCRWATPKTQRINQRRTKIFTVDGVTGTLSDVARHFSLNYDMLKDRIKRGWSIERAIRTPSGAGKSLRHRN